MSQQCPHTVNQTLLRYLFGVCLWGALHPTKLSLPFWPWLLSLSLICQWLDGCKLLKHCWIMCVNFNTSMWWVGQCILYYSVLTMSTCDAVNTCATDHSVENDTPFKWVKKLLWAFITDLWIVESEHFLQGEEQLYGMKSTLYVPNIHACVCVCVHSHWNSRASALIHTRKI